MTIIDISHSIHEHMQIFPGDQAPVIKALLDHDQNSCLVSQMTLCVHAGTHMDAPVHFIADGDSIDHIPCDRFIGKGILIDVTALDESQAIGADVLIHQSEDLSPGDFVIFRTGWDRFYDTDKYFRHPFLSSECARHLIEMGVSLVGIDAMSVDQTLIDHLSGPSGNNPAIPGKHHYPAHDTLLGNGVLIVENLCRLDELIGLDGRFAFFPLKIKGADGSPVRAVFLAEN